MSSQYTCQKQGNIRFIDGSITLSDWGFSIIETKRPCDNLEPYIFIGGIHKNAVLSINQSNNRMEQTPGSATHPER